MGFLIKEKITYLLTCISLIGNLVHFSWESYCFQWNFIGILLFFRESRTLFRQVICPSGMPAKIFEKKSPPWAKHILIHYKNKFCVSTYFTKLNYLDGLVCFPEFIIGYSKIPLGIDCVACRYLEICLCRFDVHMEDILDIWFCASFYLNQS